MSAACPLASDDRVAPPLDRGEPTLERGVRRVARTRVDVAVVVAGEPVAGVREVVEAESGAQVDRHDARAERRVGVLAGVHLLGGEALVGERRVGEGVVRIGVGHAAILSAPRHPGNRASTRGVTRGHPRSHRDVACPSVATSVAAPRRPAIWPPTRGVRVSARPTPARDAGNTTSIGGIMTDLLHWYARIHGPRALRIVEAARAGDLDGERADAASAGPELVAVLRRPGSTHRRTAWRHRLP